MNILFAYPFAFAALAALPVLLAIYLLRNRFRQFYVSSLMLWGIQRRHKQGGLNLDRLQTPLLFLLELLVLLLLAMAAAGPLLRSKSDTRRIVIVLDDSFSMLAKTDTSCRQRALDELKHYLKSSQPFRATFIRAGIQPTVLADGVDNVAQASSVLDQWQCLSPLADLDKALATAGQTADRKARILVVTDHALGHVEANAQLESWSFGKPLDNIGFLHADRVREGARDRCILTIGNFSADAKTTQLTIKSMDGTVVLYDKEIEISPADPFQMIFEAPSDTDLIASIGDDTLEIDNQVILLSPEQKHVRVTVDLKDERLAEFVRQALDVIPAAWQVTVAPHLLITERPLPEAADVSPWTLHIVSDPNAAAFVGPFIMDRSHPLTEGLDLQGVIWSAANNRATRSVPVITAGNTGLLEDEPDGYNVHHLRLYLNHDISTLQQSPNWPIFFWNLVHWRQQQLPGLDQSNWRLGSQVDFEVPQDSPSLQLLRPDGQRVNYDTPGRTIVVHADMPGVYRMTVGNDSFPFAVNTLAADESDLQDCQARHVINPNQATQYWWEYRSYDWVLLLIVLVLLALHGYLIFTQSKGAAV